MADTAVLDLPQHVPFPPDHTPLDDPFDPTDFPSDFPSDLSFIADLTIDLDLPTDLDFSLDDLFDFTDPHPQPSPIDPPSSLGSNSSNGSDASGSPDRPPSDPHRPDSHCSYAAGSPESRDSATAKSDSPDERTDRGLKRKKREDDGYRSVDRDVRRGGPVEEVDSSCLNEDEKRKLRLMRNRESAQMSRQRKKQYVEELEEKVKLMHSTISDLNGRIAYIMAENASLRQQLAGSGAKGAPPAVYPGMIPVAPGHFPWVPYSGYVVRTAGSSVPLVPIPKLKLQQAVPAAKGKKSEGRKVESRTKKVASVSLLGLLFFMLVAGAIFSGGGYSHGGLFDGQNNRGDHGTVDQSRGRVLMISGSVDWMNQVSKHELGQSLGRDRDGSIRGGSQGIPCSNGSSVLNNGSEPLFASLYVPRNDRLVKIDGNLIISSVVAGESARVQASSGGQGYEMKNGLGKGVKETDLAIPSSLTSALAVVNSGRSSHIYRVNSVNQNALPSGPIDMYADKLGSAKTSDRLPQDWFREGLEGPIFSSGMCTEVFQFDVSQQDAIVPATVATNGTKNITEKAPCPEGKLKNRRILNPHPIPLGGSTSNDTEEVAGARHPDNTNVNNTQVQNSFIVSVLVDPREAGDSDSDGKFMPKSISRIFVVVLVDSVKYITYSCVLPFKNSAPHLVAR